MQDRRGRWSSLDGVTVFGWSGSALLGGYLLDAHGFSSVFVATAAMQFTGSLLVGALLPVVPRHEAAAASTAASALAAAASVTTTAPRATTGLAALQLPGGHCGARSATPREERGVPVPWDVTRHAQRLSVDVEAEVARSFSSSISGR